MNRDLHQVILDHRSVRSYTDEDVSQADLDKLVDAFVHAPSSINGQQTSMVVVRDPETRARLAELCGNQPWVAQAPVFLVFVADYTRCAMALDERGVDFGHMKGIEASLVGAVDVGIAFGSVMNMAEYLGLGMVPIGALRANPLAVCELLDLPEHTFPLLGMCVGHPDSCSGTKPRFDRKLTVHEERYTPADMADVRAYDAEIARYTAARDARGNSHGWTDTIERYYTKPYAPTLRDAMARQGFHNEF